MAAASSTQLYRRSMSSRKAGRISAPILIDSGFRRGTDIVKALALDANAVLLGLLRELQAAGYKNLDWGSALA